MALPHTLTADFTEAVDDLVKDVTILDSTLHSRAQSYLDVFNKTNVVQVKRWPAWAEHFRKASQPPLFTTPNLFGVMYEVADELGGLAAGKRYVSAAICVCGEHVARAGEAADPNPEEQAEHLAQALHQLASTWVAFLLWPFYAYGNDERDREGDDWPLDSGNETPTPESIAREHRYVWKKQVMARDDYHCFMCGSLDSRAYYAGRPVPAGGRVVYCYTVPIILPEVCAHDVPEGGREQESRSDQITLDFMKRFCAVDDATFIEKTAGPPNRLFVNGSADTAFRKLLWCLHPTETPDRYEIKSYMPSFDVGCEHVTSHVTFVDHSESGVDLPDRELLRTHAALTGVLHRSGVIDAFHYLRYCLPSYYCGAGPSVYPASTGSAFWRSVVDYEGPEACLEVALWEAVEALRDAAEAASHASR